MPVYDCRPSGVEPGSIRFPCNVRILDARTGQRIANVFYLSTSPPRVGRFLVGPDGLPLVRATGRKIPGTRRHVENLTWAPSKMAPVPIVPDKIKEYERLEVYEPRRWVAVAVGTGEVVAKSEEVSESTQD